VSYSLPLREPHVRQPRQLLSRGSVSRSVGGDGSASGCMREPNDVLAPSRAVALLIVPGPMRRGVSGLTNANGEVQFRSPTSRTRRRPDVRGDRREQERRGLRRDALLSHLGAPAVAAAGGWRRVRRGRSRSACATLSTSWCVAEAV